MKTTTEEWLINTATEAARRTINGNGQDFVENAIDVAFEPLEKVASLLDSILGW